ncbi:MAG: hypothetical protein H6621_08865 [Halobacteriovoraceae bacterium]|nr:hypothetical protein [Halobacteriovoraceae bacterium]MCB9095164.1 hypothetical protein [Halobacteriovoraceae bacterium]
MAKKLVYKWPASKSARSYVVELYRDPLAKELLLRKETTENKLLIEQDKNFYIRVAVKRSKSVISEFSNLSLVKIVENKVELLRPAQSEQYFALKNKKSIHFEWDRPEGDTCDLFIKLKDKTLVKGELKNNKLNFNLVTGNYKWRVECYYGDKRYSSEEREFIILDKQKTKVVYGDDFRDDLLFGHRNNKKTDPFILSLKAQYTSDQINIKNSGNDNKFNGGSVRYGLWAFKKILKRYFLMGNVYLESFQDYSGSSVSSMDLIAGGSLFNSEKSTLALLLGYKTGSFTFKKTTPVTRSFEGDSNKILIGALIYYSMSERYDLYTTLMTGADLNSSGFTYFDLESKIIRNWRTVFAAVGVNIANESTIYEDDDIDYFRYSLGLLVEFGYKF